MKDFLLVAMETIALNCLGFEKIAFCVRISGGRQSNKQTDKQRDGQHHRVKPPLRGLIAQKQLKQQLNIIMYAIAVHHASSR